MPTATCLRLMSDLKAISSCPPEGCSASPTSDDNLFVWSASVFGPDDSAWEGGIFSLRITFSEGYPEKAPRIRFVSEVFHPNVYRQVSLGWSSSLCRHLQLGRSSWLLHGWSRCPRPRHKRALGLELPVKYILKTFRRYPAAATAPVLVVRKPSFPAAATLSHL